MPLNRPSIRIAFAIGIAGALIAPAAAQTAPPRTTGDDKRAGGFVTAPTARPAVPKPARRVKASVATPARLLTTIVTPEDYPPALIRAGAQGRAGLRFQISETGVVTECEVIDSTGYPELDAHTCALVMQRARFEPARDTNGDPVLSIMRVSLAWVIPTE